MNQRVTPSLTPEELELLWDFKGGHGMARMASRPDSTLRSWKESMHGRSAWPECVDTKKDGIHFSNAEAGTSRVITWKAIKAHALAHTPEDVRALICDIDAEWCQVQSMPDVPPGQWRYHTAAEKERLAQCVRLLTGLARTVWDPTLAPEATGPVQLDLFDALEGLS